MSKGKESHGLLQAAAGHGLHVNGTLRLQHFVG